MNRMMAWIVWGIILLNLLGFFMDVTWSNRNGGPGYFAYNIALLNNFPYWLCATLIFLAVNGIASLYFAAVTFYVSADQGNYRGGFPLPQIRLLGINLVLIPLLLIGFILIRALGL